MSVLTSHVQSRENGCIVIRFCFQRHERAPYQALSFQVQSLYKGSVHGAAHTLIQRLHRARMYLKFVSAPPGTVSGTVFVWRCCGRVPSTPGTVFLNYSLCRSQCNAGAARTTRMCVVAEPSCWERQPGGGRATLLNDAPGWEARLQFSRRC